MCGVALEKIYKLLTKTDVICDFWVCNKKGNLAGIKNVENFISYEDVISEVKKHSILVDLVKEGQTGITMRTMEALFYEKKLITNNKELKKADFYCENNIFIIGENHAEELRPFLSKKYVKIDPSIIERYTFENWLHRFVRLERS